MAHTPGPWRWEVNLESKDMSLNGGRPLYDLTVMDFVRWGMGGAMPRFLKRWDDSGLMVMEKASAFAVQVAGREHHSSWFMAVDHPDARLIAAAPDLLAACKAFVAADEGPIYTDRERAALTLMRAAIAKAEGR